MEVVLMGTPLAAFALVHRVGWCEKWCAQVRMRRLAVIAVIHKAIEILITPLAAVTFIFFVHAQPVAPLSTVIVLSPPVDDSLPLGCNFDTG